MKKFVPALAFILIAGAASQATARRIKPAWRGDSLTTPHTYVVTKANHSGDTDKLDLGVLRWDSGLQGWSESTQAGQADWSVKEQDPIWNMPLYAPIDGYIVSCWNDMDDVPTNTNMFAGNHVTILSEDMSYIVFLGHLRKGSVPPGLCTRTGSDPTSSIASCESLGADAGWTRLKSATVEPEPYPVVRQGEFVGNVGYSGQTSDPHLHMHVKPFGYFGASDVPCVGNAEPMEFDEAWSTLLSDTAVPADSDWDRLSGDLPAYNPPQFMAIWPEPSGIQRGTHTLTTASSPAIAVTRDSTLGVEGVVAYKASNGDLKVSELEITTTGIEDASTVTEAGADVIDIARIGDGVQSVVVAIRNTSTQKLQLLPYNIQSNRTLDKGGVLTSANTIRDVAITRAPYDRGVVVASIDKDSWALKVKAYGATVTATDITLVGRDFDTSTETLTDVDVAPVFGGRGLLEGTQLDPFVGVVTAERRVDGTGWLRTWEVADDGDTVMFADDIQLFSDTSGLPFSILDIDVSVVGDPSIRQHAVVALRHSNSNLYVQTYEIAVDGTLRRIEQWTAGSVDWLDSTDAGRRDVAVGVRTGGIFSLLSFHVDSIGGLGRGGTRDLAALSTSAEPIAVDGYWSQNALVTAAIKSDGNLSVGYYYTNYSASI